MNTLIVFMAQYVIFLLPLFIILAYVRVHETKRKQFILTFIVAVIIGYSLLKIAGNSYYDPRPFVGSGIQPLFPHVADNGFPSDHTTLSALAAFIVFVFSRRIGIVMLIFAFMIGISRVLAHVHSWIDIIGAIGIALIAAVISRAFTKLIFNKIVKDSDNKTKENLA